MKIIFYDRVYDEGPERKEFAGLESIMFGGTRLIGVRRIDKLREERIVLADVHSVEIGRPRGKGVITRVFGVTGGVTTRFFRCYVVDAEEAKPA